MGKAKINIPKKKLPTSVNKTIFVGFIFLAQYFLEILVLAVMSMSLLSSNLVPAAGRWGVSLLWHP